ncbi:MAG: nitrate- and nitrite sensing domain-containing protein, partial [Verrucomicrobiota bacterium]
MKKLPIATKLLILVLLPISGLVFFGMRSSLEKWRIDHDYVVLEQNSAVLQQIGSTVHEFQKERGRTAGFLGSKGAQFSTELRDQRSASDVALAKLTDLLRTFDAARFSADFQGKLQAGLAALGKLSEKRSAISAFSTVPAESTAYYTATIASLVDVIVGMSHLSKDADIGNGISCYVNFLQAKEQAGIERATLTGVFTANAFTDETFRRFNQVTAKHDTFLRVFESFASEEQRRLVAEKLAGPAVEAVAKMRQVAAEKSA